MTKRLFAIFLLTCLVLPLWAEDVVYLTTEQFCQRIFDCLPLIEKYKLFAPLRDKEVFNRISLDGWTVCWLDGSIDIAPEHLYELGVAA